MGCKSKKKSKKIKREVPTDKPVSAGVSLLPVGSDRFGALFSFPSPSPNKKDGEMERSDWKVGRLGPPRGLEDAGCKDKIYTN